MSTALEAGDEAIRAAAARGASFDCGFGEYEPTALWTAVYQGDTGRVRLLLDLGADPNRRWGPFGDHFPLEIAIEQRDLRKQGGEHAPEIVKLLLARGADPDLRWCPFESRGAWPDGTPGCTTAHGTTALLTAAIIDRLDFVRLLLEGGADPRVLDGDGVSVLDWAKGDAVFDALEAALFPEPAGRSAKVLAYLAQHASRSRLAGPQEETPLSRGGAHWRYLPPPPPSWPPDARPSATPAPDPEAARVKRLLARGANPNQRLTWGGVDWTQLAVAISRGGAESVRVLLEHGAQPDARWCTSFTRPAPRTPYRRIDGCTPARGLTPLMAAATRGDVGMLQALRAHGADPSLTDWKGRTARDHAREAKVLAQYHEAAKGAADRAAAGWP